MLNISMMMFAYVIMVFLLSSPSSIALTSLDKYRLPSSLTGPDSLAFDRNGTGPYSGSSDGRIYKYVTNEGFQEYAYSSPKRNKTICDGLADFSAQQEICGRPTGLEFNHQTGELYVADAYFGLVKVGPNGGPPTQLVGAVQGSPLKFTAAVDIDHDTGIVYFTEGSSNFQFRDIEKMIKNKDSSGRLFKYDPSTNQTTVLLSDLALAAGVAVSKDGSFVLVSEFLANRVRRFWLKGPRANQSEILGELAGRPDDIKRNWRGQIWVALNSYLESSPPPRGLIVPLGIRAKGNSLLFQYVNNILQEFGIEANLTLQCT